ncbi:MAG: hypothetical protein LBV51_03775 [Acholeplasmatales bacterium]|jgi:hypothetical protein|nr:hypothetical protein [Acholeplasmatales bacterium]
MELEDIIELILTKDTITIINTLKNVKGVIPMHSEYMGLNSVNIVFKINNYVLKRQCQPLRLLYDFKDRFKVDSILYKNDLTVKTFFINDSYSITEYCHYSTFIGIDDNIGKYISMFDDCINRIKNIDFTFLSREKYEKYDSIIIKDDLENNRKKYMNNLVILDMQLLYNKISNKYLLIDVEKIFLGHYMMNYFSEHNKKNIEKQLFLDFTYLEYNRYLYNIFRE